MPKDKRYWIATIDILYMKKGQKGTQETVLFWQLDLNPRNLSLSQAVNLTTRGFLYSRNSRLDIYYYNNPKKKKKNEKL